MKTKIVAFFTVLILIEIILRLGFSIIWDTPFLKPHEVIYHYYPIVKSIKEKHATTSSSTHKVLVLSCSTLHKEWGNFNEQLAQDLNATKESGKISLADSFTVFTAAGIGFSSADNFNCYRLLSDLKFDIVVYYGGINDARFNNCPPSVFKENYGHIKWNNEINCILRHPEIDFVVLPFFLDYTYQLIVESCDKNNFIPSFYSKRKNWWKYGSSLKSLNVFKRNIESIETLSNKKKEALLLVSYCYYLPKDYSLEKFKKRELNYDFQQNSRETEIWGEPTNVTHFLDSSNSILQKTCNAQCYYLALPNISINPKFFADICHFSPSGLSAFCKQLAQEINAIQESSTHEIQ